MNKAQEFQLRRVATELSRAHRKNESEQDKEEHLQTFDKRMKRLIHEIEQQEQQEEPA